MGYPGSWLRESDPHRGFHWSLERGSPPDRPEHSLCRYHHKERSRFVLFFLVSTSQTQSIGSWSSTTSCTFFSLCHLTLSTNTIDRVILEATGSDVYLAVRPVDVSFTCPPSLLPQPQTLWRPSTRTAASSPSP